MLKINRDIESYMENKSPLGQNVLYKDQYDSSLLFAIPRSIKRKEIGITDDLVFHGYDLWNCYEVSWLNDNNKPEVRIMEMSYSANSLFIIESKSLKIYLNSFNNFHFNNDADVRDTISRDLAAILKIEVLLTLKYLDEISKIVLPAGYCIDNLDIKSDSPERIMSEFLQSEEGNEVKEALYSNLLKSNCLITGQPDWGTVEIDYIGRKISHEGLLKYIISFRNHNEFHEQCVERMFMDIYRRCNPSFLAVYARYTRRGGIDINPFRSSEKHYIVNNHRFVRQ